MPTTRTVTKAPTLPSDDPKAPKLISGSMQRGAFVGETIEVPDDQVFKVTKAVRLDQLAYELEDALGCQVVVSATSASSDPAAEASKDNPLTVYIHSEDTGDSITREITKLMGDHEADPDWKDPRCQD